MQTVTLISRPGGLSAPLVESLRNAWGGGDAVWLSPDEAAEFPVLRLADNFWQVWEDLQGEGVDLCAQTTGHRRRKLLIADMDSTMIAQECIDELADAAGVGDQVKEITARAMNGELDFEGALIERVALLEGLPETVIDDVLDSRITDAPGGVTLLSTMRAKGAFSLLVSGGFTAFAGPVAERIGFDDHQANELLAREGKLTGDVARPILGREAKVEALRTAARRHGIGPEDVLAVGDGANDLGMLSVAGTGVAMHAKPAVQAECDLRINHGDLTSLLFLQGYARSEFLG
ncbi:phosphoserine phosphatase SerB [Pelagovum pacificum]|uniref:Phosphoserine phosphatase n=1 Tax=Pelagovum pacificum TaxID=2588711 RepID=A0A5C5GJ62_9RHOB|nr:phosphoserine phosphatase SerB [Pelagovum pacificum]QQA42955.1 phosphoserine phosphatase SerB [Pelagovum pacificum]TNY33901.1 phosphoserine phosphatase SerB [Pelagovum pacificum]